MSARNAWLADRRSDAALHDALSAAAELGWWGARIELLQRYLAERPEDREARAAYAADLMRMSRWVEAIAALKQLLSESPDDAKAWFNLATAHAALGHEQEAVECWAQAARLLPGNSEVLARYGEALLGLNQIQKAAQVLSEAHAADSHALDVTLNLVLALERLERYAEAAELLQEVLTDDPDNIVALNRLARIGWILYLADPGASAKLRTDSMEACRRSLLLEPDQADMRSLLESLTLGAGP